MITIINCRDHIAEGRLALPREAVYVGRRVNRHHLLASPLANPYAIGGASSQFPGCPLPIELDRADRDTVIEKYQEWLQEILGDWGLRSDQGREIARLRFLHDRYDTLLLACWCAPLRCHAEVIRDLILTGIPVGSGTR